MVAPLLSNTRFLLADRNDCSRTSGLVRPALASALMECADRELIVGAHSKCAGAHSFIRSRSDLFAINSRVPEQFKDVHLLPAKPVRYAAIVARCGR